MSESSQNTGSKPKICRVSVTARLLPPQPIARKNVGMMSENAADGKLAPMVGKAIRPMASTSALREKIPISAPGSRMKHAAPTSMRLAEMSGDLCTVSRQRAYFCAAQL